MRNAKKGYYYSKLDHSKLTNNKRFLGCNKPLFDDQNMTSDMITLFDIDDILQDEKAVAEKLVNFCI